MDDDDADDDDVDSDAEVKPDTHKDADDTEESAHVGLFSTIIAES